MKIKNACKKSCTEEMYCFGGKDETMEHQLCLDVLLRLINSKIEAGLISKNCLEDISKTKKMAEEKLKE